MRSGKWEVGSGKCENLVGYGSLRPVGGSGMLLGCLEKPPAFLEAVPSAWTVTRGRLLLGVYTDAGVPRNASGVSRGSAKCMHGNSGSGRRVLRVDEVRCRSLVVCLLPPHFYCRGSSCILDPNGSDGKGKAKCENENVVGSAY